MNKEQILRKLTSRKFWIALVSFISALLVAFNVPEASISQVSAIIMAFGSLIVYVLAEGATDVASLNSNTSDTTTITNLEGKASNDKD